MQEAEPGSELNAEGGGEKKGAEVWFRSREETGEHTETVAVERGERTVRGQLGRIPESRMNATAGTSSREVELTSLFASEASCESETKRLARAETQVAESANSPSFVMQL